MTDPRASTLLAWAARRIAVLQAPSCPLTPDDIRFEMRRVAVALEGCAEEVRSLELRGIGRSRREDEGASGPTVDRLAETIAIGRLAATIGGFCPAIPAPERHLIAATSLRTLRIPTTAMVDAGAAELAPYASVPEEIATAMRRARDAWTAMVDQARRATEAVR